MKSTYRHLFKILSCFLAIAAVLLCSVCVPVNALSNVYRPSDYIKSIEYSGNNEIVYYWFDTTPYFSLKELGTNQSYNGYENMSINGVRSEETYVFRVWPLGTGFTPGQSASGGVIDIQDFKKKSVFHLSCVLNLEAQYAYQPMADGDTTFHFISYPYVCFYRSDGSFVSQLSLSSVQTDITIEDYGNYEDSDYAYALDLTVPLQIPEGAVYMSPCFITYLYPPDSHSPHSIGSMEVSCREFVMRADKNLLLAQSETLEAIEDQMDDLNDKADTIISGSDDMQNQAGQMQDNVQNSQQDMDELIGELQDLPVANPDDVDLTFGGLLLGEQFSTFSNFFLNLSLDSLWIKMMIIVCTFVWVSTLLYGKRG